MKKQILLAITLLMMSACVKKQNDAPPSTTSSYLNTNTIILIDNGITYREDDGSNIYGQGVVAEIIKTPTGCQFFLYSGYDSSDNLFPVLIDIQTGSVGPVTGVGIYAEADTLTAGTYNYQGAVTENFNGGQAYNIDTTLINITAAAGTNIVGTFRLHLSNVAGGKVITGTINCPQAIIE